MVGLVRFLSVRLVSDGVVQLPVKVCGDVVEFVRVKVAVDVRGDGRATSRNPNPCSHSHSISTISITDTSR